MTVNSSIEPDTLSAERYRKAKNAEEQGKWYTPPPVAFLKNKEWSVHSAMFLFAGLTPGPSKAVFGDSMVKPATLHTAVRLGWEYSNEGWYVTLSRKQLKDERNRLNRAVNEELQENYQKHIENIKNILQGIEGVEEYPYPSISEFYLELRDDDGIKACSRWLQRYQKSEDRLNIFVEKWLFAEGYDWTLFDKTCHRKESVQFWLQWAIDNNLTEYVPWWSEAIQEGFFVPPTTHSPKEKKPQPQSETETDSNNKGGRPPGTLRQAVVMLYEHQIKIGETDCLREDNVRAFIKAMQSAKNSNTHPLSEYLRERVESIHNINGNCIIKTQERQLPSSNRSSINKSEPSRKYTVKEISTMLSEIRKKIPLP